MKIIDAWCGVGPWSGRDPLLPWKPEQIVEILDQCGIQSALVAWAPEINQATVDLVRANPRFLPAFVLAPDPHGQGWGAARYAEAMRAAGARAAWLRPSEQQHSFVAWQLADLLAMCAEQRLPLFLPVDATTPDQIDAVGREFPRLRLVLTGLGYQVDNWLYPLLRRNPEIRVCVAPAYLQPMAVERFVRTFGAERLLFGSGLPLFAPGGMLAMIQYAALTDTDRQKVLGGTLELLLREAAP